MKYRCTSCDSTADCRKAFGRFWNVKSGGGVGCNHKFKYSKPQASVEVKNTKRR